MWNDNPNKKRHKDIDARWTNKNNKTFYGYKNHAKVDAKSKFIDKYKVTDASVHDSQPLDDLLIEEDKGQDIYADSAYTGDDQEKVVSKYEMNNCIHQNREKSKTRARVEHVLGFMEQSMNGLAVKSVGIARASGIIGFINLTYNLFSFT